MLYNEHMINHKFKSLLFITLVIASSCQRFRPWPGQAILAPRSNPTEGVSQAIGYYSSGCLKGGKTFNGRERGLIISQTRKGRFWGHSQLIDLLTEVGEFSHKVLKKAVVIGDLSLSRGGPTVGGHSSHQNGLDVDIWFDMAAEGPRSFVLLQTEEMKSILKDGVMGKGFAKPQQMLLSLLSQDKRVQRIFVHPLIKKKLCSDKMLFNEESLRKIRPWYGHDDHLHLRLNCPEGDKSCRKQPDPPVGDGCDQLEWWFTEEAQAEQAKFNYSFDSMKEKYLNGIESRPKECLGIYQGEKL